MSNEKTSMPIIFLFCLFVFPVMFRASTILSYSYIYGIPFLYLIVNWRFVSVITKKQMNIIGMAVLLVMFSLIYPTLHSTMDYSYIRVTTFIFRKLLIYLFLCCILTKKYRDNVSIEHFMYYYALAHAIYVVGTLIMVFVPSFKSIWFTLFAETVESGTLLESYGYTFRIGWQGFAGYRVTLHCTLSCIFLLYLQYCDFSKFKLKKAAFIALFGLCFLGNMFYGRVGLVMTIVVTLALLLIWNRSHFFKIFKFFAATVALMFVIYSLRNYPIFSTWCNWAFTPIINLITTGSFNNYSVNNLANMVFMPDWRTILMGDGYFTQNGTYYMHTDSGIMRNILFWGLLGAIVSYGMTLYSLVELRRKSWVLYLAVLVVFAVFEYKGDVYYEFASIFFALSFIPNFQKKYEPQCKSELQSFRNKENHKLIDNVSIGVALFK